MTAQTKIEKDIEAILKQGQDPKAFRQGLAKMHGVSVTEIDALIGQAGQVRVVDAETVAVERLHQDAIDAKAHPAAYRRYEHEED